MILLPAHPASFAHKFLFQRVPGCNSIADLSLKIVFWTHKFQCSHSKFKLGVFIPPHFEIRGYEVKFEGMTF